MGTYTWLGGAEDLQITSNLIGLNQIGGTFVGGRKICVRRGAWITHCTHIYEGRSLDDTLHSHL